MFSLKKLALVAILVITPQLALAATWQIDPPHTSVEFKVRHLMVSWVKGVFSEVEGTAEIDDTNLSQAGVSVKIATASVDTNNKKRDDHLRSPDFFDAAKYPTMTFKSKQLVVENGQPVKIVGDLTIRDVSREIELAVEDFSPVVKGPWGNNRRGASATTEINRKDYGLNWSKVMETGGLVVGDEVKITLEVELIQSK